MRELVFASGNVGKLEEVQAFLSPLNIKVVPQSAFNLTSADETGTTFIENAIIKARYVAEKAGKPALADDSGIVVDALNGAPGVRSARYANAETAEARYQKVLVELGDLAEEKRTARFYCVLVYLKDAKDPCPLICQGSWDGRILFKPQGGQGFGYDPIFWDVEHQCSAAEMPLELKNKISHRAKALKLFVESIQC